MKSRFNLLACTFLWSVAVASLVAGAEADGQAQPDGGTATQAESASTDDASPEQPQREIAFEVSDEELESRLFRADPDLLTQRFMACVDIRRPRRGEAPLPDSLEVLAWCGDFYLLREGFSRSGHRESLTDFFGRLADVLEQDAAVPREMMEFFLSDAVKQQYVSVVTTHASSPMEEPSEHLRFRIFAPTEVQARERAETLVRMLDHAIAIPLVEHLKSEIAWRAEELEMLREKRTAIEEAAKPLDERFAAVSESAVDSDELKRLTTERRLLDVDLAGIRARIEAAEKLLDKFNEEQLAGRPAGAQILRVEDLKITAEIDLAGYAARRKTLDQIIKEGKEREALAEQVTKAHAEFTATQNRIRRVTRELDDYRETLAIYAKELFTLKDDKIVIQPIKWTGTE